MPRRKPPRMPRDAADVARDFVRRAPERTSRMAMVSVALATVALVGLSGAVTNSAQLLILGIAVALVALVVGIISLVSINSSKRVGGLALAGGGVLGAGVLIIVYFAVLSTVARRTLHAGRLEETSSSQAVATLRDPRFERL